MPIMIGIYQISISRDADSIAFEECMKKEVFPKVRVGSQTRGGIVTAQYLLKNWLGSEHDYAWIVRWENQGDHLSGVEMHRPIRPCSWPHSGPKRYSPSTP
jgi:hypothetical protein